MTLFGTTWRLPEVLRRGPQEVVGQLDVLVLGDELGGGLHVPFAEPVAAAHQPGELVEDLLGAADVGRLALDDQLLAGRTDPDAELRFEHA